jgi:hypothetical protein
MWAIIWRSVSILKYLVITSWVFTKFSNARYLAWYLLLKISYINYTLICFLRTFINVDERIIELILTSTSFSSWPLDNCSGFTLLGSKTTKNYKIKWSYLVKSKTLDPRSLHQGLIPKSWQNEVTLVYMASLSRWISPSPQLSTRNK